MRDTAEHVETLKKHNISLTHNPYGNTSERLRIILYNITSHQLCCYCKVYGEGS